MIELRAVSVTYGATPAVLAFDLAVASGGWTAIVGPNGAGKSSVLRAIAGLVAYTGTVVIDGMDAATLKPRQRAQHVAVVPQLAVVPAGMRVADYVLLGRTPYISAFASESREDRAVAARTIDDLGLARFADRPLGSLSGGELQRAVLARALAQRAPVVLLDEPTTYLDVGHQQDVLELVDSLRLRDGITVLSVMHDLTLAAQFADTLVLLANGATVASGSARDVLTEATIREHYGASVRIVDDEGVAVLPRRRAAPPTERPHQDAPRDRVNSLVIVNTGDGKGKTTAAIGTALRAIARGWRVCVVQFLKSGNWRPGEEQIGKTIGIEWWATGDGFTWDSGDMDATRALAVAAWEAAKTKILSGDYELVVLDEVTYPITWGWIETTDVVRTLRERSAHTNVILTGRDAAPEVIEIADTVSEVRNVRHAYDRGIPAMRGIDF